MTDHLPDYALEAEGLEKTYPAAKNSPPSTRCAGWT